MIFRWDSETHRYNVSDERGVVYQIYRNPQGTIACRKKLNSNSDWELPTKTELEKILRELQEAIKNQTILENQIKTKSLLETIEQEMVNRIRNGFILSEKELSTYLNQTTLTDTEKTELMMKGLNLLEQQKGIPAELEAFKISIFEQLRQVKGEDSIKIVFNVNQDTQLCEISLDVNGPLHKGTVLKNQFPYSGILKIVLIEPVLTEVVLKSYMESDELEANAYLSESTANYRLQTQDRQIVTLNNLEAKYAAELQQKIRTLNQEPKITSSGGRDAYIANNTEKRLVEEQKKERGPIRILQPPSSNNSGLSASVLIYTIILATITLLILISLILTK